MSAKRPPGDNAMRSERNMMIDREDSGEERATGADGQSMQKSGIDTRRLADCPIAARNRECSPLLRLPPELRNEIFVHALRVGYIIIRYENRSNFLWEPSVRNCITSEPPGVYVRSSSHGNNPNYCIFTRSCMQIYDETNLLQYRLNTFYFDSDIAMQLRMSNRLPIHRQWVTSIKLPRQTVPHFNRDSTIELSHVLPDLKMLFIDAYDVINSEEVTHLTIEQFWATMAKIERDFEERA